MDMLSYARIPPAVLQVEVHPYLAQPALLAYCRAAGISVTAYSPLGSGSYTELGGDCGLGAGPLLEPVVVALAAELRRSPAQVVLRWGVQRGCSVIPKSSNPARIAENFDVLSFELSAAQMESIDKLDRNMRFNDPGVYCKFMGGAIPIFA
jgi:D-xylose reductase